MDHMSPDDYKQLLADVNRAMERAKQRHWTPEMYQSDLTPLIRPPGSRPIEGPGIRKVRSTFEESLTEEDHKFLADLKVGL